jgi:hypothetical protein
LRGQTPVKRQHHDLLHAAALEFGELVAQRGDARGGQFWLFQRAGEIVARVRLEGHHATRHAAVRGLVVQQRQHRLVPAVHAVEVADGQGAGRRDTGVVEAAENLHREVLFW